jgi:hypothetical protein
MPKIRTQSIASRMIDTKWSLRSLSAFLGVNKPLMLFDEEQVWSRDFIDKLAYLLFVNPEYLINDSKFKRNEAIIMQYNIDDIFDGDYIEPHTVDKKNYKYIANDLNIPLVMVERVMDREIKAPSAVLHMLKEEIPLYCKPQEETDEIYFK